MKTRQVPVRVFDRNETRNDRVSLSFDFFVLNSKKYCSLRDLKLMKNWAQILFKKSLRCARIAGKLEKNKWLEELPGEQNISRGAIMSPSR